MFKNYAFLVLLCLIFTFSACKEEEKIPKSSAKAITKLTFPQFTPAVQATIDEATKRITAVLPPTADVTKLIPSISVSLKAKVFPDSGKVQDFTNDVTYSVTAEDGTKQDYKVMVSRTKSSGKDILTFTFADFTPAIVAKIDPATKTITATVPATADLTKLKPTITLSDRATVNPVSAIVVDFTKPVNFTVKAEDAGTQVYAVTVVKEVVVPSVSISSGKNPTQSIVYVASGGGFSIKALDALTGTQIWKYSFGLTSSFMNPTIYDGNLVLTTKGINFVNASTGELNGSIPHDKISESSPTIVNDILYYGSGQDGYLRAFNLKTKRQKWSTFVDYWVNSSPTILKNTIFVSIQNGNALKAYNLETGDLKWEIKGVMNGKSNPCTYGNTVIATGFGAMQAYDIDNGTKKWSFSTDGSNSVSSPTESEGIVYFGSNTTSNAYAINALDGTLKWKFKTDGDIDSSPIVDGALVYFYSKDSYLYALDKKTGSEKWKFKIGQLSDYGSFYKDSSPVVLNGIVYIHGQNSTFYALNSLTGAKIWEVADVFYQQYSSPCVIDTNGKVYHSGMSGMQN